MAVTSPGYPTRPAAIGPHSGPYGKAAFRRVRCADQRPCGSRGGRGYDQGPWRLGVITAFFRITGRGPGAPGPRRGPRTARLGPREQHALAEERGKRRRRRPPGAAGRLRKGLHDRGWFPKYVLDKSVGLCHIWHNMIEHLPDKPLFWIGSSLGDLKFCPDEAHYAAWLAEQRR